MIKLLISDIDGVLTDGKLYLSDSGKEMKILNFKDMDAISEIRKENIKIGIITGEDNPFSEYVKNKFSPDYFFPGCKEKLNAVISIMKAEQISKDEVCYIGDGKYDIAALKYAGTGICPCNAIQEVKDVSSKILKSGGGDGCLQEALAYLKNRSRERTEITADKQLDFDNVLEQHIGTVEAIRKDEEIKKSIVFSIQTINNALNEGRQILFCGNGGSAADAQHLATEFVSRFYLERGALNAEALTVNSSSLTAISNDYKYADVFARQVAAKGKAGDVLIGITTSGNSENVLEALKKAKELQMKTIALTGKNTGNLSDLADTIIAVPADQTPRIQEMHIMIGHIICEYVEKMRFG